MKLILAAAAALALTSSLVASYGAGDTKNVGDVKKEGTKREFVEISMADVKTAVDKKTAVFVDVNGTESFAKGHIPGAIDFVAHEKDFASLLPKDKSALIVAYCGGPACHAYARAANAAAELGYTNVKHFKDGISGWKDGGGKMEASTAKTAPTFADIEFKDLQGLVASGKVVLVDVNGSESFAKGHIPGAIDFQANQKALANLLPKDKNTLVVAYCANTHCPAWKQGADAVAALGYTNVKHFKDGIQGWKEMGGKTEAPKS